MLISLNSRAYRDLVAEFVRPRETQGLTQRDLAKRVKRSRSYVALVERGQKHIYLLEFAPCCRGLGVDPVEMFKRYGVK